MTVRGAGQEIQRTLTAWQGVSAHAHPFGGTEYRLGERRELGHVHGDHLVDIPFPSRVRDEVVAAGRAEPHHVLPDSGWVSLYLRRPEDVATALDLFRLSYDLARQQLARQSPAASAPPDAAAGS